MTQQSGVTLGQYIGEALERDARTRDQIALAVGVEGSYLSKIKSDQAVPSLKVLQDLARELHLDPAQTRQLAEAAEANRIIAKMQRQMLHIQEYLGRHAPEVLEQIPHKGSNALASHSSVQPLLGAVYRGFIQRRPEAASGPAGRVLIIDTQQGAAWDSPMEIRGPELDAEGTVYFYLHTDQWEDLPETFALELILLFALPLPECISSMHIGPKERRLFGIGAGLEFKSKLPEAPELVGLLQSVGRILRSEGTAKRDFGLSAGFAFRIRC
jgi:transcriptional regulator with XRE-family HTH domain